MACSELTLCAGYFLLSCSYRICKGREYVIYYYIYTYIYITMRSLYTHVQRTKVRKQTHKLEEMLEFRI